MSDTQGFFGQQGNADTNSKFNGIRFLIRQLLAQARDGIPVRIVAVHGGGVGPPPTVDVQPQINQVDGVGKSTPHGIVYGLAVARNHSAGGTVINDPVAGDLGHVKVSDRDISAFKATSKQSNPGSGRRHDLSDGVYHGAICNPQTPKNYINLNGGMVVAVSPTKISLTVGSSSIVIEDGVITLTAAAIKLVKS